MEELQQRLQAASISSTTLVFTFFCDVVTQHGGEIWLGHVIQALSPLGINERSVRTAVFRLVKDGWLISRKQGRRSHYRLSPTGQHYYQRAARRIYASHRPQWDGRWMLIFVSLVPDEKRDALQRGLSWLGYGRLAPAVYALPGDQRAPLDELLADLGIEGDIVHMQAQADGGESFKELVLSRWQLDALTDRYSDFIKWYQYAEGILNKLQTTDPQAQLLLRVLLIHEYRRIRLTDPELPSAMLPSDWQGDAAQAMTAKLYRRLFTSSSDWFARELLVINNTDAQVEIKAEFDSKERFPI
jgi:phenylacetic acid degradation operon negative regulatory protein